MICIARHIKAYHRQCFDREIADFGEPCSDCEFYKTCKFDWFARMKPLFENTNITIQLGRQGHFTCYIECKIIKCESPARREKRITLYDRIPTVSYSSLLSSRFV